MAIDIAGFITHLKDHAVEHGFHVHDERHFIETYSLRQAWEIDVHPESACNGPLDLNVAFDLEPRMLLELEDRFDQGDDSLVDESDRYVVRLLFNWSLPPLGDPPDLIILGAELSGVAGPDLPIEVSAVDSYGALSEAAEHRLALVGQVSVSLPAVLVGHTRLCDTLDRCREVSEFLVERAEQWEVEPPPDLAE